MTNFISLPGFLNFMYSIRVTFKFGKRGILYFVSDGFTVVAIVVVKAAQQQKSLRGFFVM